MSASDAIVSRLLATPAVVAIIGNRICPELAEIDDAFPQIVYQTSDEEPQPAHDGPSTLIKQSVTVAAITKNYAATEALSSAVRTALDYQRGTWGGNTVQGCFLEGQSDNVDYENKDNLYRAKEMTFAVWFNR